jgi:hypothetical protein
MLLMKNRMYCRLLLTALIVIAVAGACKKKYDPDFDLSRQFTPTGFNITARSTDVTIAWAPSLFTQDKDITYTLEISKELTFQTLDHSAVVDTNTVTITDAVLTVRQPYYARVKANALDGTAESNWAVTTQTFQILGEQIFLTVQPTDIIDVSVILKWRSTPALTKIVLTPASGPAIDVPLVAADLTALQKTINGLTPGTAYTAEIFAGTVSKGTTTFTTKPSLGANIIDLQGFTGMPSILADTLPDIAAGSTVVLKKGETYTIAAAFDLSKTVTIVAGYDFTTAATKIFMNGNFNIVAGSTIDSIVFRDLNIYSDSYAAKYIFNISRACTIGKIKFDGCKLDIFRGVVRLQTAVINVTDYVVNNCIIDSISNYGVLTVDNVNCRASNISMSNSTVYKAERIFVSRQNSTSVKIENCTFNEAPSGDNYLVHYNTAGTDQVTNGINITNCIMGVGKPNALASIAVRGVRANASVTTSNTYNTSDYTLAAVDPYPISGIIPYAGLSTTLFQAPYQGNFKIVDNGFPGRNTSGDPRWRP